MAKLSPDELEHYVYSRTGVSNTDVLVGPREGEDAAAIQTDDGTLVVSTDPVSLAADRLGQIGVAVAANDVAASGGIPTYLTATILLPALDTQMLDTVTAQLDEACTQYGLTIVGGHTESVTGLTQPLLSLTCLGYTDRFVSTTTATPGDRVLLTKGAGIEATAVLATDFRSDIDADEAVIDQARTFFDELSVLPEAVQCAPVATAMHDPTEGGVLNGLVELAHASTVDIVLNDDAIPVRRATRTLCAAMDLDPLCVLGSGALLITVPPTKTREVLDDLHAEDIEVAEIGAVEAVAGDDPAVIQDGRRQTDSIQDGIYALWED